MFHNSKNVVINGANFSVINHDHKNNGMELLKKNMAVGAFHNSSERYDPPKCHPQTRLAVLEAIMDWIKDGQKTSFLMWLYGPAGAGKSAIAQTIAEMCHKLGFLAGSFFWSRTAAGRNDETRLIASLAYQLIVSIPQMRMHVESVIESDPAIFSRSVEAQIESLIIHPMSKAFPDGQTRTVDIHQPKLIILDGLDECGRPSVQSYILKVISAAIQRFSLRLYILIASRPEQEIRDFFATKPMLSLTTKLCLDDHYLPDDDIRLFLVDSFNNLKESHILGPSLPESWPTEQVIDGLVQKSSGQFIYAATVIKFVKSPRRRPDEQLKIIVGLIPTGKQTPYSELDALYLHIFSMVEDFPRVLEILSCLFLHGVTSVDDIEDLLFYDRGDLYLILSDLHSVLNVPDIAVEQELVERELRVFHASLQDFLMDLNRSGDFFLDEGLARARMTQYFIRHIHKLPISGSERDRNDVADLVSTTFPSNCSKAFPTLELLRDFLSFDFKHWVLATWFKPLDPDSNPCHEPLEVFEQVIMLTTWFRTQESAVKEHFGPEKSLYDHHSDERDRIIRKLLDEEFSVDAAYLPQAPALAHPLLVDEENRSIIGDILNFRDLGIGMSASYDPELRLFPGKSDSGMSSEGILEIQQFLLDRTQAGDCYVDGGKYAALSLLIATVIFELREERHYQHEISKILRLSVDILPFYLSYSDYTRELADYFHDHHLDPETLDDIYPDITPVLEAIELYLKKKPGVKETRQRDENSDSELPRKRQRQLSESFEIRESVPPPVRPFAPSKREADKYPNLVSYLDYDQLDYE